jgi:hypothetical protein
MPRLAIVSVSIIASLAGVALARRRRTGLNMRA